MDKCGILSREYHNKLVSDEKSKGMTQLQKGDEKESMPDNIATAGKQIAQLFDEISVSLTERVTDAARPDRIRTIVLSEIDRIVNDLTEEKTTTVEVKRNEIDSPVNVGV